MKRFAPAMVLLAACGGTPAIHGTIVDRNGQPVQGAQVRAAQRPAVSTDANGRFSIDGVTGAYDLAVSLPSANYAIVYQALSRRDPTVTLLTSQPLGRDLHFSTIQLAVGTTSMVAAFIDPRGVVNFNVSYPTGAPPSSTFWYGASPGPGKVVALGYPPSAGGSWSRGSTDVTLTAGTTLSSVAVPLTPTATLTVSGATHLAPGCTLQTRAIVAGPKTLASSTVMTVDTFTLATDQ